LAFTFLLFFASIVAAIQSSTQAREEKTPRDLTLGKKMNSNRWRGRRRSVFDLPAAERGFPGSRKKGSAIRAAEDGRSGEENDRKTREKHDGSCEVFLNLQNAPVKFSLISS
jgi:hypothetical protein